MTDVFVAVIATEKTARFLLVGVSRTNQNHAHKHGDKHCCYEAHCLNICYGCYLYDERTKSMWPWEKSKKSDCQFHLFVGVSLLEREARRSITSKPISLRNHKPKIVKLSSWIRVNKLFFNSQNFQNASYIFKSKPCSLTYKFGSVTWLIRSCDAVHRCYI